MKTIKNMSPGIGGIILCLSIFATVFSNSLVHFLGVKYPTIVLLFYKSIVGFLCLSIAFSTNMKAVIKVKNVTPLVMRTIIGMIGVFFWLTSIQNIPLASASMLSLTSSFFSALGGYLFLKEEYSWKKNTSIILGFCGAVFIISPHFTQGNLFYLLPVLSALCFGISSTLTRHLAKTESEWTISFYLFFTMVLCTIPFGARLPHSVTDFFLLLCIGSLYAISQFLFVRAYKCAEASYLATFKFLKPPLHILAGFFFFKESLGVYDLIGFGLILTSLKVISLFNKKA